MLALLFVGDQGITPSCAYAAIYNLLDFSAGVVPTTVVKPEVDSWEPKSVRIHSLSLFFCLGLCVTELASPRFSTAIAERCFEWVCWRFCKFAFSRRPGERARKLDAMVEVPMRKMYAELLAENVPFNVGVQLAGRPYSEELVLRVRDFICWFSSFLQNK